jgi:hypothetical protein
VGLFYVSDRLIAAEYPEPRHGKYKVKDVGAYLEKHHAGHYMIWNLAEQDYDRRYVLYHVLWQCKTQETGLCYFISVLFTYFHAFYLFH